MQSFGTNIECIGREAKYFSSIETEVGPCIAATRDSYMSSAKGKEEKDCSKEREREGDGHMHAMHAIMLHYDCNCIVAKTNHGFCRFSIFAEQNVRECVNGVEFGLNSGISLIFPGTHTTHTRSTAYIFYIGWLHARLVGSGREKKDKRLF